MRLKNTKCFSNLAKTPSSPSVLCHQPSDQQHNTVALVHCEEWLYISMKENALSEGLFPTSRTAWTDQVQACHTSTSSCLQDPIAIRQPHKLALCEQPEYRHDSNAESQGIIAINSNPENHLFSYLQQFLDLLYYILPSFDPSSGRRAWIRVLGEGQVWFPGDPDEGQ